MATAAVYRTLAGRSFDQAVVTALSGWSDERLEALLTARPELADPPPPDFESLAFRAAESTGVAACHGRLDQWCLQVADAVCLLELPATVDGLRAILDLPVDQADLDRALLRLEDLALVFRSGEVLHAVEGLREMSFPAGLGPPAEVLLSRRTVPELREMARRLGVTFVGPKAATLAALAKALSDPRVARGVVETGPEGTTGLVEALIRYGAVTVPGGTGWMPDHTPAGWLVNRGLVAALTYSAVAMTREGGLALRGGRPYAALAPRPPDLVHVPLDPAVADAAAAEMALRLVADQAGILDGFAETPPKILKSGGVGIRDVRRIAKAVDRSEAAVARLIELAGVAGLAAGDVATGTALPLPAYDGWLSLEAPQRWTRLVEAWLGSDVHLTVAGAIDAKDKPVPPLLERAPDRGAVAQRRLVLHTLAGADEASSVDPASLHRHVLWASPALWSGTIPAEVLVLWVTAEAEALGVTAHGSLTTAGRRILGGDTPGAAQALGAFAPAMVEHFVIQADLSAMAPGELVPTVRAELELVADVESTGAATMYRFSEASVQRGLAAGRKAEEIAAFLEAHASRGVPQPLAYLVADLGRRHGRLRVGQARCYLRSDDPSLLAEVRRGRRTAALGLRELAPTVLATDAEPGTVLAALQAAGYPAAEEDAAGALVLARSAPRRATPVAHRPRGERDDNDDLASLAHILDDPDALIAWAAVRHGGMPGAKATDPVATVAALRRAAADPAPLRGVPEVPQWEPDLFDIDIDIDVDVEERPTGIARNFLDMLAMLHLACEQEWMVRLAHTAAKGREEQVTAAVIDVGAGVIDLECLPRWDSRSVPIIALRWARILTDAEEDVLL